MIDKLNFYTFNFSVGKNPSLMINPARINGATGKAVGGGFLYRKGLKSITGKKAYYYEDGIEIEIIPRTKHMPESLRLSINPSKLLNGHNYFTIDHNELLKCLGLVRNILAKVGITANIDLCKIGRIDICRNIETEYSFEHYKQSLELMTPKYMKNASPTSNPGCVESDQFGSFELNK